MFGPKPIKMHNGCLKNELAAIFGPDTITAMRNAKDEYTYTDENIREMSCAYAWRKADQVMLSCFCNDHFLVETILCDEYIAYITKTGETTNALLMFVDSFGNYQSGYFNFKVIDPKDAYKLRKEWEEKGHRVTIVGIRIDFREGREKNHSHAFRRSYENHDICTLFPVFSDGKYFFVEDFLDFTWDVVLRLYDAAMTGNFVDFESLFAKNAVIVGCSYKERNVALSNPSKFDILAQGTKKIQKFFKKHTPRLSYVVRQSGDYPRLSMLINDRLLSWQFNRDSQIETIALVTGKSYAPYPADRSDFSTPKEPKLCSVRPLPVEEMHAYAVQASFDNGITKNYYLKTFDTEEIPHLLEIEGKLFDESVLKTASRAHNWWRNGVVFSNGFYIPKKILYRRGKTQRIPKQFDEIVFENEALSIRKLYRLPLENAIIFPDGLFGPYKTLLTKDGTRLTDFSAIRMEKMKCGDAYLVQAEGSGKWGILKANGTWHLPPVYDSINSIDEICAVAEKDGRQFFINRALEKIPFEYHLEDCHFCNGCCRFSAGDYEGDVCYPDSDRLEDLRPGHWGYLDTMGKILVPPRYIFADSFSIAWEYAVVARMVEGELRWGAIDPLGNEIIPCRFKNLTPLSEQFLAFQENADDCYGLIDRTGQIFLEPSFRFIDDCEMASDQTLYLVVGNENYRFGVYSLKQGRIIIPMEHVEVYLDDDYIECDLPDACFNYQGEPIEPPEYLSPQKTPPSGRNHLKVTRSDDFILTEKTDEYNHSFLETLHDKNGRPIFTDLSRNIQIEGDHIQRDTPHGRIHYRIERK